ncbi:hypothetical protein [Zooshikella sp. RANM57]|uniref:hypothetical protein n=1 Tax=Zooshikella sp. RANM57 TaxID=3425863 RepID=UPI003D6EF115
MDIKQYAYTPLYVTRIINKYLLLTGYVMLLSGCSGSIPYLQPAVSEQDLLAADSSINQCFISSGIAYELINKINQYQLAKIDAEDELIASQGNNLSDYYLMKDLLDEYYNVSPEKDEHSRFIASYYSRCLKKSQVNPELIPQDTLAQCLEHNNQLHTLYQQSKLKQWSEIASLAQQYNIATDDAKQAFQFGTEYNQRYIALLMKKFRQCTDTELVSDTSN